MVVAAANEESKALTGRIPGWVFALVIGGLLGLAMFFETGVVASDDTYYLEIARHWQPGAPQTAGAQMHARIAFWYPIRVATWVVGDSWRALVWPPLVAAGIALAATAGLGRRWFGDRAALLAVVTLGLTTQFLIAATVALPDITAAAAVATALWLVGPALAEADCQRVWWRALAGGLLIGVGYSAKELAAIAGPALGLFVLLQRTRCAWAWKRYAVVALGAGSWLAFEAVVLWHYTGDPLFHLTAVRESQAAYGPPLTDPTWHELLDHWTLYVRWLLDPGGAFGWWGPVFLAAAGFALWKADDRRRLLLCVIVCLGLYLSLGSSDLSSYTPLWQQPRYLMPALPMAALLAGFAADRLLRRGQICRAAVVAAGVALGAASLHRANESAGRWYAAADFAAGRAMFEGRENEPAWAGRLCASGHTAYRLHLLFEAAELGEVEGIGAPPGSSREWIEQYGGRLLVVSGADRRPAPPGQKKALLTPASVEALSVFERVAVAAPATSRVREVLSGWGVIEARSDEEERIEVVEIPRSTAVVCNE